MNTGPKKGYKQTAAHIEKRKRFGKDHPNWKGDGIVEKSGRSRALRLFPAQPCEKCGMLRSERHHRDGDTSNNSVENVRFLCRKCHMQEDGRYEAFIELAKSNLERARQARRDMPKPTHCPRGHAYVKFNKHGCGVCYECLKEYKRNKRKRDRADI